MKKFMLIAALMVVSLSASAQGLFLKPMAGGTLTTLTGDVSDLKMKLGFVGGAEVGYQFKEMFAVTAGALYSMQGAKFDSEFTKYNVNLDYLNVPLMLAVYPVKGFGIKAGAHHAFEGGSKVLRILESHLVGNVADAQIGVLLG